MVGKSPRPTSGTASQSHHQHHHRVTRAKLYDVEDGAASSAGGAGRPLEITPSPSPAYPKSSKASKSWFARFVLFIQDLLYSIVYWLQKKKRSLVRKLSRKQEKYEDEIYRKDSKGRDKNVMRVVRWINSLLSVKGIAGLLVMLIVVSQVRMDLLNQRSDMGMPDGDASAGGAEDLHNDPLTKPVSKPLEAKIPAANMEAIIDNMEVPDKPAVDAGKGNGLAEEGEGENNDMNLFRLSKKELDEAMKRAVNWEIEREKAAKVISVVSQKKVIGNSVVDEESHLDQAQIQTEKENEKEKKKKNHEGEDAVVSNSSASGSKKGKGKKGHADLDITFAKSKSIAQLPETNNADLFAFAEQTLSIDKLTLVPLSTKHGDNSLKIARTLTGIIRAYNIQSILDLSCRLLHPIVFEIYPMLIQAVPNLVYKCADELDSHAEAIYNAYYTILKTNPQYPNGVTLFRRDFALENHPIPTVDLVIAYDFFQRLDRDMITIIMKKLLDAKVKYVLLTTNPGRKNPLGARTWRYARMNFHALPYELGAPIRIVDNVAANGTSQSTFPKRVELIEWSDKNVPDMNRQISEADLIDE
eukprot:CAMPEP_0184696312 /NCGR_PEP_ID=MMETSP0313-20130426/3651_1 /TAXON_ID=2792 /ORGANISM="Porphyridium aerugineum, Strain SAG 1380-2" /LENGTH=583 /DNA_ID=CAMNT_0027154919 /DNA_START=83 /DNA_END=1834 /DNA_ORIENTATION=+